MLLQTSQPLVSSAEELERTMSLSDGTELFYRHWSPAEPGRNALLLFHRGHEHSGRLEEFAKDLGLDGFHVLAWDQRGHGRSPGARGYAPSFSTLVRDMDEFVRHLSARYDLPLENMVVLGHSVAAVLVSAWVHDYAPPIRAMVLATPAFRVKLYVPFALPGLRAAQRARGRLFITSYVKPRMLTHDARQAAAYEADPLISRRIAVNILLGLHDTSTRLSKDAGTIRTPTMILTAGSDWVVKNSAIARFHQRLGSRYKQLHHFPGFHHAIFHETDRHLPTSAVRDFIEGVFRLAETPESLLDADRAGYTKDEYDRLSRTPPPLCPRGISYSCQKVFLKTIPRLSAGVRLGWRTGFDSGQSLDHVYANRARGITPLGKLIDRIYLNAIGWRGIRIRKQNLERMLLETIARVGKAAGPVRIVDIAAGPGRYVLDAIRTLPADAVSVVLRDHNAEALEAGRRMAREMGLGNVRYESGNAFDPAELGAMTPRPDIAIVSGLYELFPENRHILRSLRGLAAAVPPGGYLLYTNQPWHPQIEMIARVLINRERKPWIMRRRTTGEMDQLAREAGFQKLDMRIDPYGIFTVSVARRIEG